ncbi:hypothetical protein BC826DRAFT_1032655, partial [Russula brevipes]
VRRVLGGLAVLASLGSPRMLRSFLRLLWDKAVWLGCWLLWLLAGARVGGLQRWGGDYLCQCVVAPSQIVLLDWGMLGWLVLALGGGFDVVWDSWMGWVFFEVFGPGAWCGWCCGALPVRVGWASIACDLSSLDFLVWTCVTLPHYWVLCSVWGVGVAVILGPSQFSVGEWVSSLVALGYLSGGSGGCSVLGCFWGGPLGVGCLLLALVSCNHGGWGRLG